MICLFLKLYALVGVCEGLCTYYVGVCGGLCIYYVGVCGGGAESAGVIADEGRAADPPELELPGVVNHLMWRMWGTQLGSSAKAVCS